MFLALFSHRRDQFQSKFAGENTCIFAISDMKYIIILMAAVVAFAASAPTETDHDHRDEVAGSDSNTLGDLTPPKDRRTVVTYDQRQEGKFNVRADLENFVIVFVPSSPSQGMNLLELLTNLKRSQSKHASHKKRIHAVPVESTKDSNAIETHKETPSFAAPTVDQFIEGRTPYRVDINSEPAALSHLHPEVVKTETPTSSPLLSLVKPAALAVEQPLVQITEGNAYPRRFSRSLSESLPRPSQFDSNSVVFSSNLDGAGSSYASSGDGSDDDIITSPYLRQLTDPIHSFDSLIPVSNGSNDDGYMSDDWRLLGSSTAEACGPDMRRDSYGTCRYYPATL